MSEDTYAWMTSPSARERRRTGEKNGGSPPMNSKNPGRLTRGGPGSGSNLVSGMKMYATSMTDYASRESEAISSPTSSAFLISSLFPPTSELKSMLNGESANKAEKRWDSLFTVQSAPYGGRTGEVKVNVVEELLLEEEPGEIMVHTMSSGSSNASSDSVTSSASRGSRSGSQPNGSLWADFSSPLWDSDMFAMERELFEDVAPYTEELEVFMMSYYAHLKSSKVSENWDPRVSHLKHVTATLERFAASRSLMLHNLAQSMNAKHLVVPCAEFDLPSEAILLLNSAMNHSTILTSDTAPTSQSNALPTPSSTHSNLTPQETSLLALYSQNPVFALELTRLRWFLDRMDTNKQVLAFFIWSLPDASLIALSCSKVLPYPLCRGCASHFGIRSCGQCQIAKYCSRTCQIADWEHDHQFHCAEMRDSLANRTYQNLELSIEPITPSPDSPSSSVVDSSSPS